MFCHFIASKKTKQFQAVVTTGVLCRKNQFCDNEFTLAQFHSCVRHYFYLQIVGNLVLFYYQMVCLCDLKKGWEPLLQLQFKTFQVALSLLFFYIQKVFVQSKKVTVLKILATDLAVQIHHQDFAIVWEQFNKFKPNM